jgi:ribosome modulation factor
MTVNLEQRLRETVARGYCDDKNCNKVLDSDLLDSIVYEIMLALAPDCHPDRKLPLMRLPVAHKVHAFSEGQQAHASGASEYDNPYTNNDWQRAAWQHGWETAEACSIPF